MNSLRYIKDLIWKNKIRYIIGIVCLIFVDFLQLILPKILGNLTDSLQKGNLIESVLFKYSLYVAGIAFGIAIFRFLWRYFVYGVAKIIEAELRDRLYLKLQTLSTNYYNNHKTGDLMAHATNDINNVRMAFGQGIALAVDSTLIPIVAVIMMFNTAGYKLTIASFSPMIILAIVIGINAKLIHDRMEKMQEAFSALTEKTRENFSGIRIIKAFVRESFEISSFDKINTHNKEANLRFAKNMQILFPLIMAIASISSVTALIYGGILVIDKAISLGDFIAFNSYILLLMWPIASLGWVANMFQRGIVSLDRLNNILDEKPEIIDSEELSETNEIEGKITFKNLDFTYPGSSSPTLSDINITINKGKTLAIVGRTGSGKTTLISLISRLYNVPCNAILLDDIDINALPLSLLRKSIGFVPQDTFLFSTTIKQNIDFFEGNSIEKIHEAAKQAKVFDNISEFPQGFDTVIGERGITLSGGQKQRIAIARALIRMPKILILDDCLSAVDTQTEEKILRDLKIIMKQRTSIIVSHRISTIKDADEIIVLEKGKIVERGTHESLIELRGFYFELYEKQLLKEQIEEVG